MFETGLGVARDRDYDPAGHWFEKAANLGSAVAMRNLGRMYESGFGVAPDLLVARQPHFFLFLRNALSTCFLMSPKFLSSVFSSASVKSRNGTRTTLSANFTFSQY
jgi:TPR repeat protein